jgi:hypothetical protein
MIATGERRLAFVSSHTGLALIRPPRDDDVLPAFRRRCLCARAAPVRQTVRSDENIALCLAGVPRIEAVFRAHVGDLRSDGATASMITFFSSGVRSRWPILAPAEGGGASLDARGVCVAVVLVAQPESAKPKASGAVMLKLDICKARLPF